MQELTNNKLSRRYMDYKKIWSKSPAVMQGEAPKGKRGNNMMILTNEQETVIQYSRDGEQAIIWTSDKTQMTRLDKLVEVSDAYEIDRVDKSADTHEVISKTYALLDKSLISFRKNKKQYTEEQKQAMAERLNGTILL